MKILQETKESIFKISVMVLILVSIIEIINFATHTDYFIDSLIKSSLWGYWAILIFSTIPSVIFNKNKIIELFKRSKLDFFLQFLVNADLVFLGYMFVSQFLK